MSSPVSLDAVRKSRAAAGQMSQPNGFGGRRMRAVPEVDRAGFVAWWAGVMRRRCHADAVVISRTFEVTEQTGRNWLAEFSCPLGHHVDLAMVLWPEEFAARYGVGSALRVAA